MKAPMLELPPTAAAWLPGARSIRNLVMVAQPVTGGEFGIPLWDPVHGATSWMIAGTIGAGKGVLLNNIIAGIGACADAWLLVGDVSKKRGKDARRFGKTINKLCTTHAELIEALEGVLESINNRALDSAENGYDNKHQPSPDRPLGVIVIDELASAIADEDDPASCDRICYLLVEIARLGRSEGWCVVLATQRPDAGVVPTKLLGYCPGRIQLPVVHKSDAQSLLGTNFTQVTVPLKDTHRAGTFVCIDERGTHEALNRTYTLDDFRDIERVGRLYAGHRPELDEVALRGAARVLSAAHLPRARRPHPRPATPERKYTVDDLFADDDTTAAASEDTASHASVRAQIDEVEARLAALKTGYGEINPGLDVPVGEMFADHQAPPVEEMPGDRVIRGILLAVMRNAQLGVGGKPARVGVPRKELVAAVEAYNLTLPLEDRYPDSASSILRASQQLREKGLARSHGRGVGAYWAATDEGLAAVESDALPASV